MSTEAEGIDFLTNLVNQIDMKIIRGPFASYVDKDGNKGLTAIVMIETSHIAFHIWDEVDPGVFSLGGWSPHVQTGFHVPRPTQFHRHSPFTYRAITFYGRPSQTVLLELHRLLG